MITPLRHAKGGQVDKAVASRWHGVVAIMRIAGHRVSRIHGIHGIHAAVVMARIVDMARIMGLHAARARLMTVGHLAGRRLWREQGQPTDHGHLIDGESKRHLKLVLHDLVVVKLDVGWHQIA